jgi:chaperonin GroEL
VNAGLDGSVIVGNLLERNTETFGYDAQKCEFVGMFSAGIIDPAKVMRLALQNAASVAGLLITTQVIIAEQPEQNRESAAACFGLVSFRKSPRI